MWANEYVHMKQSIATRLNYIYQENLVNEKRNGLPTEYGYKHTIKPCTLVPLYSWNAKYITLDTDVVYEMFHHLKSFGSKEDACKKNQVKMWRCFYKIPTPLLRAPPYKVRSAKKTLVAKYGIGT